MKPLANSLMILPLLSVFVMESAIAKQAINASARLNLLQW